MYIQTKTLTYINPLSSVQDLPGSRSFHGNSGFFEAKDTGNKLFQEGDGDGYNYCWIGQSWHNYSISAKRSLKLEWFLVAYDISKDDQHNQLDFRHTLHGCRPTVVEVSITIAFWLQVMSVQPMRQG